MSCVKWITIFFLINQRHWFSINVLWISLIKFRVCTLKIPYLQTIDHNLIRMMINPIDNVMFIEKWNCYVKVFPNYLMGVVFMYLEWRTPKLLDRLDYKSKGENSGRIRSWGTFLGSQHFKSKGACWSSGMRLGRMTSRSIIHMDLHKPNNKLVST
jgi:hypothetical protein